MSTTIYADAHSALVTHLQALPTLATLFPGGIEFEGQPFDPNPPNAYLRETLAKGQSRRQTIGPKARIRHDALYLLDIFTPKSAGVEGADACADCVQTHFEPAGPGLVGAGGTVVTIDSASAGRARPDSQWRMTPVTIAFHFFTITTK